MTRLLLLCAALAGCATNPTTSHENAPLNGLAEPYALAKFPGGFEMDGITGDERVVFTGIITPAPGQPVAVLAASRLTGRPLGSVTPPPAGFQAISAVAVLDYQTAGAATSGELLVVDVGALPPNAHVTLYHYRYSWSLCAGLQTTLEDAHQLPQLTFPVNGVGYAGGVALLPGGGLAIADALAGAIWTCGPGLDDCHLAMVDQAWGAAPAPPSFTGIGRAPGGGTRPYTLAIANGLMPGLLSIDYVDKTDEVCGLVAAPPGGIYCVSRTALVDQSISPFMKTKRPLVTSTVGLSDGGHGIAYDHWNP